MAAAGTAFAAPFLGAEADEVKTIPLTTATTTTMIGPTRDNKYSGRKLRKFGRGDFEMRAAFLLVIGGLLREIISKHRRQFRRQCQNCPVIRTVRDQLTDGVLPNKGFN